MKQAVLTTADYLKPIVDFIISSLNIIGSLLYRIFKAFTYAKQQQANYNVALQLWKTEFRKESFDTVLAAVNKGNLNDLKNN